MIISNRHARAKPASSPAAARISIASAVSAIALRRKAVMPLQTLANLLAALRESDFSIRARSSRRDDSLGEGPIHPGSGRRDISRSGCGSRGSCGRRSCRARTCRRACSCG